MSDHLPINFQDHFLVDLDMQDGNGVPQQGQHEFVCIHTTHVDLDAPVSKSPNITKALLYRWMISSIRGGKVCPRETLTFVHTSN